MKNKKNLTSLRLKKEVISNLEKTNIKGGEFAIAPETQSDCSVFTQYDGPFPRCF